jgi:maltodextrin utilization protein YvdJ
MKLISLKILILILFLSCSSREEKHLAQDLAMAPNAKTYEQMNFNIINIISDSQNLTNDQKVELIKIHETTKAEIQKKKDEIIKLQQVLTMELVKEDYNSFEVELIKRKMVKSNKERLKLTFNAIDKVNKILGRIPHNERAQLLNNFYDVHSMRN